MGRDRITIEIKRRKPDGEMKLYRHWSEMHDYLDMWILFFLIMPDGDKKFVVYSKRHGQILGIINRTEQEFINAVNNTYGPGDYTMQYFARGIRKDKKTGMKYRQRGRRRFWDGIITHDGKYLRRKEESLLSDSATALTTQTEAKYAESFIGKFFKTRQPMRYYYL